MPTTGEIHLEPINRCTIYNDYYEETTKNDNPTLSITKFLLLWRVCYPSVKIREYKAVTGTLF
jgi:phage host-nuclease inhibitor protein Gam